MLPTEEAGFYYILVSFFHLANEPAGIGQRVSLVM